MARRRRERSYMPATSAGILAFYQEEAGGIKIKPAYVIAAIIAIAAVEVILQVLLRGVIHL